MTSAAPLRTRNNAPLSASETYQPSGVRQTASGWRILALDDKSARCLMEDLAENSPFSLTAASGPAAFATEVGTPESAMPDVTWPAALTVLSRLFSPSATKSEWPSPAATPTGKLNLAAGPAPSASPASLPASAVTRLPPITPLRLLPAPAT